MCSKKIHRHYYVKEIVKKIHYIIICFHICHISYFYAREHNFIDPNKVESLGELALGLSLATPLSYFSNEDSSFFNERMIMATTLLATQLHGSFYYRDRSFFQARKRCAKLVSIYVLSISSILVVEKIMSMY